MSVFANSPELHWLTQLTPSAKYAGLDGHVVVMQVRVVGSAKVELGQVETQVPE